MDITQKFYDSLASEYDKLFLDWQSTTQEQALILERLYSPPYIHKTDSGQRVSLQTWDWDNDHYKLTKYIIDDQDNLQISKFECEYRAIRKEEITTLLLQNGCKEVKWLSAEKTGFYQPIVIARKLIQPISNSD